MLCGDGLGVYIKSHPRGVEASGRPNLELHFSISSISRLKARESVVGVVNDLKKELGGLWGASYRFCMKISNEVHSQSCT